MKTKIKSLLLLAFVSVIVVGCANNNVSINKELFKHKYAQKEEVVSTDFFVYQDAKIKDKSGKVADVYVGVPLTIVKDGEKESLVEVEGYMFGNEIYSSEAKSLLVAKLADGFEVEKKADNKVSFQATISKELISNSISDVWAEREEFYYEMCSQCHAANQASHHSMIEWGAIFETMKGFAKLDEQESTYLIRYLQANASDGFVKVEH